MTTIITVKCENIFRWRNQAMWNTMKSVYRQTRCRYRHTSVVTWISNLQMNATMINTSVPCNRWCNLTSGSLVNIFKLNTHGNIVSWRNCHCHGELFMNHKTKKNFSYLFIYKRPKTNVLYGIMWDVNNMSWSIRMYHIQFRMFELLFCLH